MGNQASQPKLTAQDKAIFQLKQQRDNLKKYQKKLSVVVDKQLRLAKNAVQLGNVAKAKVYLRLKKQQESVINSTYDQLQNIENLIGTIEFKLIEKDVLYGLSQGNEVLKKLNTEMSVDKIDKVMDDLEDERIKVDEISDVLGAQLTHSEEAEVDQEFLALQREYAAGGSALGAAERQNGDLAAEHQGDLGRLEQLPDTSRTSKLPDVPQDVPLEAKEAAKEPAQRLREAA